MGTKFYYGMSGTCHCAQLLVVLTKVIEFRIFKDDSFFVPQLPIIVELLDDTTHGHTCITLCGSIGTGSMSKDLS